MSKHFEIDNKKYVSSVEAGKSVGYSNDYLSRLCRGDKLDCKRIGRAWFIEERSLAGFVNQNGIPVHAEDVHDTRGRKPELPTNDNDFKQEAPPVPAPVTEYSSTQQPVVPQSIPTNRNVFSAKNFNSIQQQQIQPAPEEPRMLYNEVLTRERNIQNTVNGYSSSTETHAEPVPQAPQQSSHQPRELQNAQRTLAAYEPKPSPLKVHDVQRRHAVQEERAAVQARAASKKTFGPVISFFVAAILMTSGGYIFAYGSETDMHTAIRNYVAAADKAAFGNLAQTKKTLVAAASRNTGDSKKRVAQEYRGAEDQEQVKQRAQGTSTPSFDLWDIFNKARSEVVTKIAALPSVIVAISDTVLAYGTRPADALASALASLSFETKTSLQEQSPLLYEPSSDVGEPLAFAEEPEPRVIEQTIVNQPIRERVVEQHFTVVESGVTLDQLQQTENELRKLFGEYSSSQPVHPIQNFRNIALSQKIDNLGSVDITGSTFSGGTISDSSASLTTLSTSGNVTIGGDLTVTGSTSLGSLSDLTLTGDLTVLGDDITLGTNTSGFILVADGTNFNPVAVGGDATISATGTVAIAADAVTLGTDTTGNYLATLADAGNSFFTITGSGSESAAVTIDIADDSLDFAQFSDTLTVDATTTVAMSADLNFDSNTLVIDASANRIGIGTANPTANLDVESSGAAEIEVHSTGESSASVIFAVDGGSREDWRIGNSLSLASAFEIRNDTDVETRFMIDADGQVGIGGTPNAEFTIFGFNGSSEARFDSSLGTGGTAGGFRLSGYGSNGTNSEIAYIDFELTNGTIGTESGRLAFGVESSGTLAERMVLNSAGDVGIGVTDPDIRLEVFETVAEAQLKLSYDATRYAQFQTDSAGDLVIDAQGGDVYLNDENLFVCTGGSCPAGTPASTGTIVAESRVGIGVSDPAAPLEFAATAGAGAFDDYTDYKILLFDSGAATSSYGIGVESNTFALNTVSEYDFYINGNATPEVNITNATSTFQGDLVIAGKLDVDTIDPVYTISGVKYATYGHSTIGIKEEAAIKLTLQQFDSEKGMYYTTIDFDEVERGSDLWLFYQVSSFGKDWGRLLINLTPAFEGVAYYEENPKENSVTIYSNKKGKISARFIADRYDAHEWPNLRPDQGEGWPGHVIEEK